MLRSDSPSKPPKPHGGKHDPPPNPDDRFIPYDAIKLFMYDVEGKPVVVTLSRRAAAALADELYRELSARAVKGGTQ